MKRSRTDAAEGRQRLARAAADRFQREAIDAGRGPIKWNPLAEQSSSLRKALSVIGDRWTLLILNQCFLKLRRYGEIQSSLGLSKPLLAVRLKKMVRLGVLKKVPSRKSARVHEYLLTEKGRQLYPVLLALVRWGNALVVEEAQPPIREHVPCGRRRE
jgi:DNA-binding HxlR family transcriptional regulator